MNGNRGLGAKASISFFLTRSSNLWLGIFTSKVYIQIFVAIIFHPLAIIVLKNIIIFVPHTVDSKLFGSFFEYLTLKGKVLL
jgi:hypothetical protein